MRVYTVHQVPSGGEKMQAAVIFFLEKTLRARVQKTSLYSSLHEKLFQLVALWADRQAGKQAGSLDFVMFISYFTLLNLG